MTRTRRRLSAVCAAAALALSAALPAHAIVVTGRFAGLADVTNQFGHFPNSPYTGTFSIDLDGSSDFVTTEPNGDVTWWGSTGISFSMLVDGWNYVVEDGSAGVTFRTDATSQSFILSEVGGFGGPTLTLVGSAGALFDAPGDLASLRLDAVNVSLSSAGYFGRMTSGSGPLTSFQVDGATAPIPEPGTTALMLAGLAAMGAVARRSRKPQGAAA